MPIPKKNRAARDPTHEKPGLEQRPYLDVIHDWQPIWMPQSRLDTKLARARAQDEPVLCAHLLPGLDMLLCPVPGAQPPYPCVADLRQRCLECIQHALEQPLDKLDGGGYWYEFNGLGILIFASVARARILQDFCAGVFSPR